jgi:hypothetical protein
MGMFLILIIKRIEKYEEGVRFQNLLLLLIRVKLKSVKAMDISDEGVNVRRAPKTKKKTLSTLVILYSHKRCWF